MDGSEETSGTTTKKDNGNDNNDEDEDDNNKRRCPCCGLDTHLRVTSKLCPKNPENERKRERLGKCI